MRQGPDGPRLFPPEVAIHAVKLACERPDTCGRSLCLWDCQEIARQLIEAATVEAISPEAVRRMLGSHRLKPWRKRMWLSPKVPRDAAFAASVRRICDLYTRPLQAHERVICTDEHTSIQPRTRLHPTRPAGSLGHAQRESLGRDRSPEASGRVFGSVGSDRCRPSCGGEAGLSGFGQCADAHRQASAGLVGETSPLCVGASSGSLFVDEPDRAVVFDFGA
jgi:hypothetical protein